MGVFLDYELATLLLTCIAGLLESFNDKDNNNGIKWEPWDTLH